MYFEVKAFGAHYVNMRHVQNLRCLKGRNRLKTKVSKDLVGASTRMMVLGAISRESSWGYDIVRRLNESADGLFEWSEGTVYPVLHKLENEGLIRGKWQESEASRRRKYYSITPKGRAALTGGAEQWSAFGKLITQLAGVRHA